MFILEKSIKVRFVFDLFFKGYDGFFLNDYLETGLNYINSLFNVLIVWRWDEVGYFGDIRKMFN